MNLARQFLKYVSSSVLWQNHLLITLACGVLTLGFLSLSTHRDRTSQNLSISKTSGKM